MVLGDDDVLLEGGLAKVMNVLKNNDYGVVFLRSFGFLKDFDLEKPANKINGGRIVIYSDKDLFLKEVNYWVTFISGNIVNKSLIKADVDLKRFANTSLIQLSWVFPALLQARENVVMNDYIVAAKTENTGGYKLFKVFGTNMNLVMRSFVAEGLSLRSIEGINRELLLTFFPVFVLKFRSDKGSFGNEDVLSELRPYLEIYSFLGYCCSVGPLAFNLSQTLVLWYSGSQ